LIAGDQVLHFDNSTKEEKLSHSFIPTKDKVRVLLTCGASCPDAVMEEILRKLVSFFPGAKDVDEVVNRNLQSS